METRYCFKHEHSTLVQHTPINGYEIHEVLFYNEFGMLDIDWCDYALGWSYCEMPEVNPDWELNIIEPSPEELELIEAEFVM